LKYSDEIQIIFEEYDRSQTVLFLQRTAAQFALHKEGRVLLGHEMEAGNQGLRVSYHQDNSTVMSDQSKTAATRALA